MLVPYYHIGCSVSICWLLSLIAGIASLLQKSHGIYHERSFRSTRRSGCAEVVGVHVLSGAFDEQ